MGCDIHCYVEWKKPNTERWRSMGGRINPGRDYHLFATLAGVRGGSVETSIAGGRGVPADVGYEAQCDNEFYIVATRNQADGIPGLVFREIAEGWVARGASRYTSDARTWVTHPDWHSHSWATPAEWRKAIDLCACSPGYFGIAGAMEEVERRGYPARVVFWFDN